MSIWLVFWIIISLSLIGFLGWSLYILQQQKAVWKAFASKHKLRYKSNALMESAEMNGSFDTYKLSFFTGEHYTADMRGVRKLTAIEVSLNSVMPIDGAVASGGMVQVAKDLGLKSEIRPQHKSWKREYIATGENRHVLEAYLTDARIEALAKLMELKNSWVVLIFKADRMLLRVDTPNPLSTQEYLEKIAKLIIGAADVLELKKDEARKLKAETIRRVSEDTGLTLDDKDLEASTAFELEDDGGAPKVAEVDAGEESVVDSKAGESEDVPEKKAATKKTKKKN